MKEEIIKLEEELRLGMLAADTQKLDELIADSLIFVAPNGELITKQMDLTVQKNKIQQIYQLDPSDQQIEMYDNFAVVTVKMDIKSTFAGVDISGKYRYIRTWAKINSKWQIVAGSVVAIQG